MFTSWNLYRLNVVIYIYIYISYCIENFQVCCNKLSQRLLCKEFFAFCKFWAIIVTYNILYIYQCFFFSVLENWRRTTLRMLHRSNRGRCRWKWRNQKSIYVQSALKTSSVLRNPLGFARVKIYAMTVGSWPVMIAGPFRGRWRQRWVACCASTNKSLHTPHI